MIDLFEISDSYTFRLINLIFVFMAFAAFFVGSKYINRFVKKTTLEKEIVIKGKEFSFKALLTQVLWVIGLFFLYGAIGFGNPDFSLSNILHYEIISNKGKPDGFKLNLGQIVGALVVIFTTKVFINILRLILSNMFKNREWIDESRKYTLIQLSKYVVYTISLIIILRIFVGNISSFLIGASALFVGLGLGLQEFFTDLVAGFILLNDGSIRVGDIVELNNSVARIEKINIRTSHVKTTEGKTIIVPNSKFTEEYLTNWSISDEVTRFHIDVSVAYGTDTKMVKELLYNIALSHPRVEKNKEILVLFRDFGDSGLKFQLYFWAKRTWDIIVLESDLRFEIDRVFRENEIKIPYPQRDLHIVSDQRENRL